VRTIDITCEKCGNRVEENRSIVEITTGPMRNEWPEIDLCLGCVRALMVWGEEDRDEIGDGKVDDDDSKV